MEQTFGSKAAAAGWLRQVLSHLEADTPASSSSSSLSAASSLKRPRPNGEVGASSDTALTKTPGWSAHMGFVAGAAPDEHDERETTMVMIIPEEGVRYVIGKGGQNLRAMEASSPVTVRIQRDELADPTSLGRHITLFGTTRSVTIAFYRILTTLHDTCGRQIFPDWAALAYSESTRPSNPALRHSQAFPPPASSQALTHPGSHPVTVSSVATVSAPSPSSRGPSAPRGPPVPAPPAPPTTGRPPALAALGGQGAAGGMGGVAPGMAGGQYHAHHALPHTRQATINSSTPQPPPPLSAPNVGPLQ